MNLLPLITLQIVPANLLIHKRNIAWFATQAANSMKEFAIGQCRLIAQRSTIIQANVSYANRNIFITRLQKNVPTPNQIIVISMMEEGNVSSASKTISLHQGFVSALALSPNLITVIQMIKEGTVWSA